MRPLLILALCLSVPAFADGLVKNSERKKEITILAWTDHFTFGLLNTAGSGLYAGLGRARYALKGKAFHRRKSKSGRMLVLDSPLKTSNAYALGPFHFNAANDAPYSESEGLDRHESGHGIQSGTLGSQVIPLVLIGSLYGDHIEHPHENWGSAWGHFLDSSLVTSTPFEAGWGATGKGSLMFEVRGSLAERSSRLETYGADELSAYLYWDFPVETAYDGTAENGGRFPVEVSYRLGNFGVRHETGGCGSEGGTVLEAGLFERRFLTDWSTISSALRLVADADQKLGAFEIDIDRREAEATYLSHRAGYGLEIGRRNKAALDVIGRAGYRLHGKWSLTGDSRPLVLTGLLGVETKLHLLDAVEFSAVKETEKGTGGYRLERRAASVGTPRTFGSTTYTGIDGKKGRPRRVYGNAEISEETERWTSRETPTKIRLVMVRLGGRF